MWLGGREANPAAEDDVWVWDMSGLPVDQTMWYPGEPNNHQGLQDHICVYEGRNGLDDCKQFNPYVFLCETEYLVC